MAQYSGASVGLRILVLLLLVVALALGGLIWFDYLGVLDAKDTLAPFLGLFGIARRTKVEAVEDPLLLERERLEKEREAVEFREAEVERQERDLAEREANLEQKIKQIEEREESLQDREKSFSETVEAYENRRVNLRQLSEYLVGMPPKNAVEILLEKEDQDVIDIFRITEDIATETGELSLVAYWISLMPAQKAAELTRKMSRKPVQEQ